MPRLAFVPAIALAPVLAMGWLVPVDASTTGATPRSIRAAADSIAVVVPNRVVLDLDAPVATVWRFVPGVRVRPGAARIPLNGAWDRPGGRFDFVYRDSTGKVTRHDRLEVLHYEPAVRFTAFITQLPPAPPVTILFNVDLQVRDTRTHLVMDAYATLRLPRQASDSAQVALWTSEQRSSEAATRAAYEGLKREIEAAARR